MDDKILNIFGIAVDRKTNPQVVSVRETEPKFKLEILLELLNSGKLEEIFPNGYLIYIHKTNSSVCQPILNSGIIIKEKTGHLESTMSLVFDSKSKYPTGDMNYLFNSINTPNQYDSESVLAIFERHDSKLFSPYPENLGEIQKNKKVPAKNILGYITKNGKFYPGKMMQFIQKIKTSNQQTIL